MIPPEKLEVNLHFESAQCIPVGTFVKQSNCLAILHQLGSIIKLHKEKRDSKVALALMSLGGDKGSFGILPRSEGRCSLAMKRCTKNVGMSAYYR